MADALYFIHAITAVHAGTGQGIDAIDLPIAREKSTSLPFLPGSSLKGCLRDHARVEDLKEINVIFGPERGKGDAREFAGAISVSDGQLLLLPVRSLAGTFVWATCPYVLSRLARDCREANIKDAPALPSSPNDDSAFVADKSCLVSSLNSKLVLEELDLTGHLDPSVKAWAAWLGRHLFPGADNATSRAALESRLVLLSDRQFFFLARTATEIQAHIALDHDKGTVLDGALWYQEALPSETVLVGLLRGVTPRGKHEKTLSAEEVVSRAFPKAGMLQVGGKAGTGQGWVRLTRAGGAQ